MPDDLDLNDDRHSADDGSGSWADQISYPTADDATDDDGSQDWPEIPSAYPPGALDTPDAQGSTASDAQSRWDIPNVGILDPDAEDQLSAYLHRMNGIQQTLGVLFPMINGPSTLTGDPTTDLINDPLYHDPSDYDDDGVFYGDPNYGGASSAPPSTVGPIQLGMVTTRNQVIPDIPGGDSDSYGLMSWAGPVGTATPHVPTSTLISSNDGGDPSDGEEFGFVGAPDSGTETGDDGLGYDGPIDGGSGGLGPTQPSDQADPTSTADGGLGADPPLLRGREGLPPPAPASPNPEPQLRGTAPLPDYPQAPQKQQAPSARSRQSPSSTLPNDTTIRSKLQFWPVPGHTTINPHVGEQGDGHFGPRARGARFHWGADFQGPVGTPVVAAGDGVVKKSDGVDSTYGNQIVIDHGDRVYSQYGHLNQRDVHIGERVVGGQIIGKIGRTGNVPGSANSHLHFEVRLGGPASHLNGGHPVDPLQFYPTPR